MPLVKRAVEPADISRGHLGLEVKDELECVANNTLACIIQQLSSLSKHSEDLFGELYAETYTLATRTNNLCTRIERLKQKIVQLNPTVEEVLLQEINLRKPFKSSMCRDQQIMVRSTRPFAINEVYMKCEAPPALNELDVFREDGKNSLKFFTDPNYFVELWYSEMKAVQHQQKRQKHKHGHLPKTSSKPKTLRTPKNRIEEFKDLRHGPEFVENFRKEHIFKENISSDGSNKNKLVTQHIHPLTEFGVNHTGHSSPGDTHNVTSGEHGSHYGIKTLPEERTPVVNSRSSLVNQIISPRPTGPPPAPPVLKKQSPLGHSEVEQHDQSQFLATSPVHLHAHEIIRHREEIIADGQLNYVEKMSPSNYPQLEDSFSSENALPPPPPSPPKGESYSFEYSGQLPSPSAIPPPPVVASDHEPQSSPLPPPPPLPESLLNQEFLPSSVKGPNDLVTNIEEEPSPIKSNYLQPDQETISSSSSATCSTTALDGTKVNHIADKGPLIRDTRSDLLAAIREGIQLRKVEENRLKSEQNKRAGPLDVQSIMEVAFEMRRKALEENDSDQDEDDEDANWSD